MANTASNLQFSNEQLNKCMGDMALPARLLYVMTRTKIVIRQEKEDILETVNTAEVAKLQNQATKLLGKSA